MARTLDAIDREIREVKGRTFKHLGDLLIEIVDRKLYQDRGFTNVEDYFQSEPNLPSARQAFRLISATRFSRQLPATVLQPKSERQVRPLLGRKRDEARLLWTIATLVAEERHCALDGKFVATVAKEFDDGLLSEFIPEACDLLGDAAPHLDVTDVSTVRTRRPKKKRDENDDWRPPISATTRRTDRHEALYASWDLARQIRVILHHVRVTLLYDERGASLDGCSPQSRIFPTDCRKRQRLSASVADIDAQLNVILTDALSEALNLAKLLGQTATDTASMTSVSPFLLPRVTDGEEEPSRQTGTAKNGSSEDELSVAEALVTMSHLLPDHV